jgi:hypothetical protein
LPGGSGAGLTERARDELRPGEALLFDWHRLAICCAVAGEVTLRRGTRREAERRGFRPLSADPRTPLFAHPRAFPHLAGRPLSIDCRRRLGVRRFVSDLPTDFGLRSVFGRLPEHTPGGHVR